ncbi:MAG: alpha/beta hydrolase [Rhizobiaceae bacterium]
MSDMESAQNETLFETSGNPIPDGSRSGFATTPDGIKLRYARWETQIHPSKGTVILLQGRSEHIEKYFETVEDLRKRGFGVLTFDWRGQGGSDRMLGDPRKGHVENFEQYLTDLETMLSDVALPDCKPPHYILAHSTGGLVALLAAPAHVNRIRRMVLASPLLALNRLPLRQSRLQGILGALTFLGLGRFYLPSDRSLEEQRVFLSNNLTSDSARFQRNRQIVETHEQLALGPPTISWTFAACRAMARVSSPGYSNSIGIPTLMVAAGSDPIVSPTEVEIFGRKMRSGAFLTISGAKHELLQERDFYREQLLAAFDAFVPGTEF